jgi:hypothetical protein
MKAAALVAMPSTVVGTSPEQDHLPRRREAVGHQRIPVVHRACEMHVEDEGHAAGFAEASVGETDTVGFDKLRRSGLMRVRNHDQSIGPVNTIVSAISSGAPSRFIGKRETRVCVGLGIHSAINC